MLLTFLGFEYYIIIHYYSLTINDVNRGSCNPYQIKDIDFIIDSNYFLLYSYIVNTPNYSGRGKKLLNSSYNSSSQHFPSSSSLKVDLYGPSKTHN